MRIPTGIHVDCIDDSKERAAASWNMDGARYHVWFSIKTMKHHGVLYKNPPLGVERHSAGHFDTRKLDITSATNAKIVKHVFEAIADGGMLKAALAAKDEQDRAEFAKRKQDEVDNRRERFVKILAEMIEHDREEMMNALSAQLSMDDLDELNERLP